MGRRARIDKKSTEATKRKPDFTFSTTISPKPEVSTIGGIQILQQTLGNKTVQRLFKAGEFQAALGADKAMGMEKPVCMGVAQVGCARIQRAPGQDTGKPIDPDTLGPLFIKKKPDIEKQGLTKYLVKSGVDGLPYVLFSPHSEAGKTPLWELVEGSEVYLIRSGQIYRQVWAQQKGKSADVLYWGWLNPKLMELDAPSPAAPTERRAEPAKQEPPPAPITAEPNVKCPEGMDDKSAMQCYVKSVRETVRHLSEGDIYRAQLKHAVELLKSAGFGRLEGTPFQFDPSAPLEWSNETYNKEYWTAEDHPRFKRKLVLKPDKQPSDAIDDMFANLGKWNVDCGQFVQVAHLYALRHALGTDGFNGIRKSDVAFELKPQGSTGVRRLKFYERFKPDEQMLRYPEKERETKGTDDLLKEAPVGSRVMWTNLQASAASAYRSENTLKLGDDQFAAHGFAPKNIFSRKELELKLASLTTSSPNDEYIKANVFIAEIEHYQMPQNPKP